MIKWLQEHPDAFGILPFLLYQENDDVIAANAINGVSPTSAAPLAKKTASLIKKETLTL